MRWLARSGAWLAAWSPWWRWSSSAIRSSWQTVPKQSARIEVPDAWADFVVKNRRATEAIFQFSLGPGNRAGSDCDFEAGMLLLKRRPGRIPWRVVKVQQSWLARKGRDLPLRISHGDRALLSNPGV